MSFLSSSLDGSDNDDVRMRIEMEGKTIWIWTNARTRALGWINFLAGCSFFHSKTFCSIKYISEQLNSRLQLQQLDHIHTREKESLIFIVWKWEKMRMKIHFVQILLGY